MASKEHEEPRFFVIEEDTFGIHDTQAYAAEPVHYGDAPRCPSCNDILAMKTWLPPFRIELELHGKDFGDFVKGPGNSLLLSERMAEAYLKQELTGLLGFHPAEVVRVRRKGASPKVRTPPRYQVVIPCFSQAAVDVTRSHLRYNDPVTCQECRSAGLQSAHGFALEAGTWQGEDMFRARGMPGKNIVSWRLAELIASHSLTNMKLIPTEEYIRDPLRLGPP
ncbi:hypothetical protein POL68_04325 [Stigmatella sp. ncwal1]|uniref:Uncharacterized protein n=1 Tax=Stigmatella ashevillensis TaxID=2995309 RepID=A0ABT5D613_9BACT|nr:hypothetical protein [Stigmatella ashevillena]MDC0707686.1 hypothetical protein [Stigmatella ashevillena]